MGQLHARKVVHRLGAAAGLALLHGIAYFGVTRTNAVRPEHELWNLSTPLDLLIPHVPATWPLYWLVYPFVPLVGLLTMLRLSDEHFHRAVSAVGGMMLIGATVQLLLPARAPWPPYPAPIQEAYHTSGIVLPYANLPSMHVAFAVLTAAMFCSASSSRAWHFIVGGIAAAITVGTLTLKEHFLLDAVAGIVLALATWRWWRAAPRPLVLPEAG